MIGRIFLFGTAVVSLLLLTLIFAIVSGQYQERQPTPEPSPSIAEPSASAAAGATVTISSLSFGPDLTIAAGTTVTFTNHDSVAHTATNGTDGVRASASLFDLELAVDASATYTFTEAGTYQVTCTLHPTMNMTITVE